MATHAAVALLLARFLGHSIHADARGAPLQSATVSRRTTTSIDLNAQTVWIDPAHATFNEDGSMTVGDPANPSAMDPPWAPKMSALNLEDPTCTWTLEIGFHITDYSGFKYMSIGFGDNAAINGQTWHNGNFIAFQEWSQQEGTPRGGLSAEGSETGWTQMSLSEFFGNPSSKKYARISYRADSKIDFEILSEDKAQVLFSRVYYTSTSFGWPENVQNGDRSLVQFTVRSGASTWSDLTVEHSGTCPSPPGVEAAAVGDPHLQNIHGERFDLMKEGDHVLINIPRGASAENALLRAQADARKLGRTCTDMYFQALNITGSWAVSKQAGGFHYSVSNGDAQTSKWVAFGKVELKIVVGHTVRNFQYLNVYVKHLGAAGFPIGGLLGEDDHESVSVPPETCVKRLSLKQRADNDVFEEGASVAISTLS